MTEIISARSRPANPPVAILGVPFDNVTMDAATEMIERMVASRSPHYVVTANVDFLVQAQKDVELHRILCDAHLVLCDGTPVVWASRLLGNPLPERVAGADLVPKLMRIAARNRYRVFLLGATPDSVEEAASRLRGQHPDLVLAGCYSPPFNQLLEMDHDEIRRRVLEARPDLLLVSLGCPKQEKWIAMHYRSLGVPVSIGVGATIDFLAGRVRRAPGWMRRSGTEWMFRLLQEPRRLCKRYAKDLFVFSWRLGLQFLRLQWPVAVSRCIDLSLNLTTAAAPRCNGEEGDTASRQPDSSAKAPKRFDVTAIDENPSLIDGLLAAGKHCVLDMREVRFIDSTGIALLIDLQRRLASAGRQLILAGPRRNVRRALRLMRLNDDFCFAPDLDSAHRLVELRAREPEVTAAGTEIGIDVKWRGEITAANADRVWEATRVRLESTLRPKLAIDLSGVEFLDSSGVRVMMRAKRMAGIRGLQLVFVHPRPVVRNVLRFARCTELLLANAQPQRWVEATVNPPLLPQT